MSNEHSTRARPNNLLLVGVAPTLESVKQTLELLSYSSDNLFTNPEAAEGLRRLIIDCADALTVVLRDLGEEGRAAALEGKL